MANIKKEITPRTLAKHIAISALNLKAESIKVLDLKGLSSFTDFFVICSGTSDRHVSSIAENIIVEQKKLGYKPLGVEGLDKGEWVLIDYGSVVAHVFHPTIREYYNVERLWGDSKKVSIKDVTA